MPRLTPRCSGVLRGIRNQFSGNSPLELKTNSALSIPPKANETSRLRGLSELVESQENPCNHLNRIDGLEEFSMLAFSEQ